MPRDSNFVDNPVVQKMSDILLSTRLLKAISMTGVEATSELESFHAAINRNAPKMVGFSYSGMVTRLVCQEYYFLCSKLYSPGLHGVA